MALLRSHPVAPLRLPVSCSLRALPVPVCHRDAASELAPHGRYRSGGRQAGWGRVSRRG